MACSVLIPGPFVHSDRIKFYLINLQLREENTITLLTIPNLITGFRVLLTIPLAFAVWSGSWWVAAVCLAAAIGSDLLDGYIARRFNQATPLGALLDHGTDALLVTVTTTVASLEGTVTWILPLLILVAFTQYAIDSGAHQGKQLRGSSLGRLNGLAYYAICVGVVGFGLVGLPSWPLWLFSLLLVGTTIVSIVERFRTVQSRQN
ncbi:MAG: CDP-alcohol phosphatidyltransferase family protein [Pseudomonadota bacterium]